MSEAATTRRFLVTRDGHVGEWHQDEASAVESAKSRSDYWIVCFTTSGGDETRQRVWPSVDPA